jgi:hypothetical protein
MPLLISIILFVVLTVAVTVIGMKMYVRPKAALDRVVETTFQVHG